MSDSQQVNIVGAYCAINNSDNTEAKQAFDNQMESLSQQGIVPLTFTIDPLSTPWFSDQQPHHFRSGCAPIMALEHAVKLIQSGEASAIIISADEPLKTGYSREQRHELMAIYEGDESILDWYNKLALEFMNQQSIDKSAFITLSKQFFSNYQGTYQHLIDSSKAHFGMPSEQWFNHVTSLFRGVDCANPLVDFSGKLLLCNDDISRLIGAKDSVCVAGVNCQELSTADERQSLDKIAQYQHLQQAFTVASTQANVNFKLEFEHKNALLEVYTCYPVVPMAFLLSNGFVSSAQALLPWLENNEITVTGGMNLARAPWNAPTLNALITMTQQLANSDKQYGLVHGNGGLGYRQGVAILSKTKL